MTGERIRCRIYGNGYYKKIGTVSRYNKQPHTCVNKSSTGRLKWMRMHRRGASLALVQAATIMYNMYIYENYYNNQCTKKHQQHS